jgi:hypothetical protein
LIPDGDRGTTPSRRNTATSQRSRLGERSRQPAPPRWAREMAGATPECGPVVRA